MADMTKWQLPGTLCGQESSREKTSDEVASVEVADMGDVLVLQFVQNDKYPDPNSVAVVDVDDPLGFEMADCGVDQKERLKEVGEEEEDDLFAGDEEQQLTDGAEDEQRNDGAFDRPLTGCEHHAHVGAPVGRLVDQLVGPVLETQWNEQVTVDRVEHEVRPTSGERESNNHHRNRELRHDDDADEDHFHASPPKCETDSTADADSWAGLFIGNPSAERDPTLLCVCRRLTELKVSRISPALDMLD
jgi:hypothetical protein